MSDEIKNENSALESFLSRENETNIKTKEPKKKGKKNLKVLIISLAAVLVLTGVILLLVLLPKGAQEEDECAVMTLSVNDDGLHEAEVALDENGKILKAGDGTLITYDTAAIKTINLDNEKGNITILSETPTTKDEETGEEKTDTTVYKIEGYEDLTLQTGQPDAIASKAANLTFTKVASLGENLSEFGLDKPKAVVTTTFNDDTRSIIKVGANAPQNVGTYINFGTSSTVYVIDTETAEKFMFGITDLVGMTITETATDVEGNSLQRLTLSGTNFERDIELAPNDDDAIDSSFKFISPENGFANETEATNITGCLRGLMGVKAICINPSDDDLEKYGLKNPYAKATAIYPDATFTLLASKSEENNSYVMNEDSNIIYQVATTSIPWSVTSEEKLKNDVVLLPNKEKVKAISISVGDTDYDFDVETKTETVDNENGESEEVTNTTASYKGTKLDTDNFNTFFQNFSVMNIVGEAKNETLFTPSITITFKYSTGRDDDTIMIYENDSTKCPVALNSKVQGTIYKSYIEKFKENVQKLIKNEPVDSI